jgi:hypothetical protein
MLIGVAVCAMANAAAAQAVSDTVNATARQIAADERLFTSGFGTSLEWGGMIPTSGWKLWTAVPVERRPKLSDLQSYHGKWDRAVEESAPALRTGSVMNSDPEPPSGVPTRKVVVHYYGSVGFGVETPVTSASVVIVITNSVARR